MIEVRAQKRRTSSFFIAIILIILILSITAFYQAMNAYFTVDGNPNEGNYFIIIGIIGIAVSAYMLLRTKRGIPKKMKVPQRVSTAIQCEKCGFKKIRNFERGDYIFKEAETCPKCNEKMMIASIYRELERENRVK